MIRTIVFFFVIFFISISIVSESGSLPRKLLISNVGSEITKDQNGIRLKIFSQPIGPLLKEIHNQTGISFKIPESILNDPITASIWAPDWPTALAELLQDYNRIELWTQDLGGSRIQILGNGEKEAEIKSNFAKVQSTFNQKNSTANQSIEIDTGYYQNHPLGRGDLVAFKPGTRNRPVAKQIIAVSGDKLGIKEGKLIINDLQKIDLPENQIKTLRKQLSRYRFHLPKGLLIVSSKNVDDKIDSLDFRVISARRILGKVNSTP